MVVLKPIFSSIQPTLFLTFIVLYILGLLNRIYRRDWDKHIPRLQMLVSDPMTNIAKLRSNEDRHLLRQKFIWEVCIDPAHKHTFKWTLFKHRLGKSGYSSSTRSKAVLWEVGFLLHQLRTILLTNQLHLCRILINFFNSVLLVMKNKFLTMFFS